MLPSICARHAPTPGCLRDSLRDCRVEAHDQKTVGFLVEGSNVSNIHSQGVNLMMSYDRFSCIRPRSALKALSVLVLSCGLSACDPPWSAKQSEKSDASMASAGAKSSPQASSRALLSSISPSIAAAKEEAPREINENQPIASKVELTPREQEGNPDGNAELAVIYENAETLGDTVGFVIDKREYSLKRDPKDPKKFVSLIDFDFDLFEEEQENRRQQIAKAKATKFPVFKGRELVAENEFEFIDAQFLKEAREKSLSISIHQSLIAMPLSTPCYG